MKDQPDWTPNDNSDSPILQSAELHVWNVDLEAAGPLLNRDNLSADERARADRFFMSLDRQRFTAGRSLVRRLLGNYLGQAPSSLNFADGPKGKPEVEADTPFQFNISHAGQRVLVAISNGLPVGVDVEAVRSMSDMSEIARRFFTQAEYRAVKQAPAEEWHDALKQPPREDRRSLFFRIWTRKEAVLKCLGLGIGEDLQRVDVLAGKEVRWADRALWLQDLPMEKEYRAAIATTRAPRDLRLWNFV